jgi:competence protein ComEA
MRHGIARGPGECQAQNRHRKQCGKDNEPGSAGDPNQRSAARDRSSGGIWHGDIVAGKPPAPKQISSAPLLRCAEAKAQNVRVRAQVRLLALVVAALVSAPAARPQSGPPQSAPRKATTSPPVEARVDINRAGVDQLLKVPGMTRSWAGRIVRFRPYWTKQDLLDRGVLSSQAYDRIKDFIVAHRQPQ